MALVDVKTPAFLVGKQSFDQGSAVVIIAADQVLACQIAEQVNRLFVTAAPPADQIDRHRGGLSEPDLAVLQHLFLLERNGCDGMGTQLGVSIRGRKWLIRNLRETIAH
jgi:hypothetical protein